MLYQLLELCTLGEGPSGERYEVCKRGSTLALAWRGLVKGL
jgi:hypothetical protein